MPRLTPTLMEQWAALVAPEIPAILEKLVEAAKQGNPVAARLVLDRVYPIRSSIEEAQQREIDELRGQLEELRAMLQPRAA